MRGFSVFLDDERGSETIQFVLFVPLFVFLLVIVADASFLFLSYSEISNVARDTARRMAAGQFTSDQEAVDYAVAHLTMFEAPYDVSASYDPNSHMAVLIEVGIADAMVFGKFLGPVLDKTLRARVVMRSEPEIATGGGAGT